MLNDIEIEVERMKKDRDQVTSKIRASKTERWVRLLEAHKGVPALSTSAPKLPDAKLGQRHRLFMISTECVEAESGPNPWAKGAPDSSALAVLQRLEWAKSQATEATDLILVSDGRNQSLRGKFLQALGTSGTTTEFISVFLDSARFGSTGGPGWMTFSCGPRFLLSSWDRRSARPGCNVYWSLEFKQFAGVLQSCQSRTPTLWARVRSC